MMSSLSRYANSGITVLMLAIFVAAVTVASGYPEGARFMPFVLGFPAIGLCLLQLVLDARVRRRAGEPADTRSEFEQAEARISRMAGHAVEFEVAHQSLPGVTLPAGGETTLARELTVWAYLLGFIGGVLVFGFWVAMPVFLVSFLRFHAKARWLTALPLGLGGSIVLYAIFERGLAVSLHPGFIPPGELLVHLERAAALLRALFV